MKLQSIVLFLLLSVIFPLSASTVLILGDSLSAGYGMDADKGWVRLLQDKLTSRDIKVVNLSASGDTTSNGLAKLPNALKKNQPTLVVIELGANDGLRGLSLLAMKKNLNAMVAMSLKSGARVLLLSTPLPPNYGPHFLKQYQKVFADVAAAHQVVLVSMFLDGVAGQEAYMQKDGLHPNERAQAVIFSTVWPHLEALLPVD